MKAVWQRELTVLCGFVLCALQQQRRRQQQPLQRLNEEVVNMHEGRTPPFTSPDALAQREMERHGTSKTLNSYLYPRPLGSHCAGR